MNAELRFLQLEITTHCNFTCFYCAGRDMPQRHMPLALFESILARFPSPPLTVSLQGEGEPMLHPQFWAMVALVKAAGHRPYTITNGSALIEPERIAAEFPMIGISVDTLDEQLATEIGRVQLPRVLANIDRLLEHMTGARIVIQIVDLGQPLDEVRRFVAKRGMRHIVQPLQRKEDYRSRYAERVPSAAHGRTHVCTHLRRASARYFNIDGIEMPCAFIKDVTRYESVDALLASFRGGEVPAACTGCSQLT